eukprot:TRINITY_DN10014_c0_g1_i2.p1 TRINITY_DN10014_c0_g1~~TRINITY_DN10014_c0_g1_i2.p1  ORF type:complete len:195 (+),score=12.11 TRINITY_DN10014_c0_g1_i2:62-586(+)
MCIRDRSNNYALKAPDLIIGASYKGFQNQTDKRRTGLVQLNKVDQGDYHLLRFRSEGSALDEIEDEIVDSRRGVKEGADNSLISPCTIQERDPQSTFPTEINILPTFRLRDPHRKQGELLKDSPRAMNKGCNASAFNLAYQKRRLVVMLNPAMPNKTKISPVKSLRQDSHLKLS